MSSVIAMNDMKLGYNETEKTAALEVGDASKEPSSRLLSFGDLSLTSEDQQTTGLNSNQLNSELGFVDSLGGFSMTDFNDVGVTPVDLDHFYNSSKAAPLSYREISSNRNQQSISSFSHTGMEETSLYSRHSLGGVFGYGENTMEPFSNRNDLTLTNLQDVMDDDLFGSSSQNMIPSASSSQGHLGGVTITPGSSLASVSGSINGQKLCNTPSLFSGNDINSGFNPMAGLIRGKDLSPSFGAGLSRGMAPANKYVLGSFDGEEYNSRYSHSLTPQASTRISSLYMDAGSGMMSDFVSDSGYSPHSHLSPIPISPHYPEADLSPRRMFTQNTSSNRHLLIPADSPQLQRSKSLVAPSKMGSGVVDPSLVGFRGQTIKHKDSVKSATWQTGDIDSFSGHIKDMSRDHNGCRALQQCLDDCPEKIVALIYEEVGGELVELMMDSFGNYLFQKLLDVSSVEQRREVLKKVKHKIVEASYNVHGTRSVQRLIQTCTEPDLVKDIMDSLRGNIADLSSHSNGNHVIQRCLQYMPEECRVDVFEEVVKSCVTISTHRHGCCVVQRCLDSAPQKYHNMLLDAIVEHSEELICNPFGNYVIQYLIEHGKPEESERITRCVLGRVAPLSREKYSSNVIEKILTCATTTVRGEIVKELAAADNLRSLLNDKFANYVIQKALKLGNEEQQRVLFGAIRPYEEELSKSTGGRHILSQLNDLAITPKTSSWVKTRN